MVKKLLIVSMVLVLLAALNPFAEAAPAGNDMQALYGTWASSAHCYDGSIFTFPDTLVIPSDEVTVFCDFAGNIKLAAGDKSFQLADVYLSADEDLLLIVVGGKSEIFKRVD